MDDAEHDRRCPHSSRIALQEYAQTTGQVPECICYDLADEDAVRRFEAENEEEES